MARGFEYEPVRQKLQIANGQRELELRLKRWCHMNDEGWYSGDSHVHFLSAQGSHTEAKGEDLNVVHMLQSQWGTLFTDKQEFTGGPSVSADGNSIVYISQENRQHFLGHLILLGLKEPVMPWCSDGPGEAEMGGTVEVEAEAECIFPIHCLQVVQEGRAVAEASENKGTRKLSLKAKVKVEGHSWLAARVADPGYQSVPHYDGWGRGIFAHTSPVYIACGGEWWMFDQETATYMLTLVDGCIE